MVDRLREKLTTESLQARIRRMAGGVRGTLKDELVIEGVLSEMEWVFCGLVDRDIEFYALYTGVGLHINTEVTLMKKRNYS